MKDLEVITERLNNNYKMNNYQTMIKQVLKDYQMNRKQLSQKYQTIVERLLNDYEEENNHPPGLHLGQVLGSQKVQQSQVFKKKTLISCGHPMVTLYN